MEHAAGYTFEIQDTSIINKSRGRGGGDGSEA